MAQIDADGEGRMETRCEFMVCFLSDLRGSVLQ